MAGYIFSLNDIESLKICVKDGVYSTNLSEPKKTTDGRFIWLGPHEGTFADYLSMKEGDNVYFFKDRNIYGVGELINIKFDCKLKNFPDALNPEIPLFSKTQPSMLINKSKDNLNNRCLCTFKPSPNFFTEGVDMDDVLSSNANEFRSLRSFWKLSFIKIDDKENKALKDIILKKNEKHIYKDYTDTINHEFVMPFDENLHKIIESKVTPEYIMNSTDILNPCGKNNTEISHEMAIEAHIIDILSNDKSTIFGSWDYISHQVAASPFKPVDYMDKMDVFGYRNIPGYDIISKYLLIELKKDTAKITDTKKKFEDPIAQTMKYVDWINHHYANGDYAMIEAFIVAHHIPQEMIDYKNQICTRTYIKGRRPVITGTWNNLRLIEYKYNSETKKLDFIEVG